MKNRDQYLVICQSDPGKSASKLEMEFKLEQTDWKPLRNAQ